MSKCIITYKGKDYAYEEFASMMHDGLLSKLVEKGVIDESGLTVPLVAPKVKTDINKVIDAIKKSLLKIDVVIDDTLVNVAGKIGKDGKLYINPNYAGLDTPIHEAGHILIDAMGDNKVVKVAIDQLKTSPLWEETKARYPELSEANLGKEVLAEAIGREGADIFDTQVEKNKFIKYLDYIFDWLKTKLGINKNIAKSLAKQIIGGIGTKNIESSNKEIELLQKEKEDKPKAKKIQVMGFNLYRETYQLRDVVAEEKAISRIDDLLETGDLTSSEEADLKDTKAKILYVRKSDRDKYSIYKSGLARIKEIKESISLNDYEIDELVQVLNDIESLSDDAKEAFGNDVAMRIALKLQHDGVDRLKSDGTLNYVESVAKSADISNLSIKMMVLSHADEKQPALQELSKLFDNKFLDKEIETNEKQRENADLAREVIREKNKKDGIIGQAVNLFSSGNAKYFEYMDRGDGFLYSMKQGREKGFSKAQLNYLQFMHNLINDRTKQMMGGDYDLENLDTEVIKTDKKFKEAYKSEGLIKAFSYYLGGGTSNLSNVRIEYKDPITGATKIDSFSNIEKRLAELGKKGTLDKAKALALLLHYNFQARRQLKKGQNADEAIHPLEIKGNSEYSLNSRGQLVSKFDKPRGEGRSYSKDFYTAANEFISETAHTKHLSGITNIAQSVQLLAKKGYIQEGILEKPNVAKYLEEWMNMHLFKKSKENDPLIDATLRKLRALTSMTTMLFNTTAQSINLFMGNYNNWRSENAETFAKGNARFFGGKHEFTSRGGYGTVNPYAMDIIRKYSIANIDGDSNPRLKVGSILEKIGSLGTRYGEVQIQSTLALGLMSEKEFNSFHYVTQENGVKKLEVKPVSEGGVDEKILKERIISYTNRASDIQGKYGEKDRRNIMNGEIYKAVFQFKVWIPDWWKERYGAEYIDRNNVVRKGNWSILTKKGIKDFKKEIDKKGFTKAFWENKQTMASLKGVMITALFLSIKYSDDDDDRKRKAAGLADKMVGNMLFIFDPDQLSYTVSSPVASLGTAKKLVDATGKLLKFDADEAKKASKDLVNVLPAKKLIKYGIELSNE